MDNVKKIDTPYNNAVSVLNKTNQLLLENNIKDSTGEAVAQLDATPANPAWIFAIYPLLNVKISKTFILD